MALNQIVCFLLHRLFFLKCTYLNTFANIFLSDEYIFALPQGLEGCCQGSQRIAALDVIHVVVVVVVAVVVVVVAVNVVAAEVLVHFGHRIQQR